MQDYLLSDLDYLTLLHSAMLSCIIHKPVNGFGESNVNVIDLCTVEGKPMPKS